MQGVQKFPELILEYLVESVEATALKTEDTLVQGRHIDDGLETHLLQDTVDPLFLL